MTTAKLKQAIIKNKNPILICTIFALLFLVRYAL